MSQSYSGVKPGNKTRTLQEVIEAEQVVSYPTDIQSVVSSGEFGNRLANIVRLAFTTLGWLILLRILFKFIAAQPNQPIASFVYEFTEAFVAPFYDIVANETFDSGSNIRGVAEFTSMVAIVVYNVAGRIIANLVKALFGKKK